jgi:hypothetical protein
MGYVLNNVPEGSDIKRFAVQMARELLLSRELFKAVAETPFV